MEKLSKEQKEVLRYLNELAIKELNKVTSYPDIKLKDNITINRIENSSYDIMNDVFSDDYCLDIILKNIMSIALLIDEYGQNNK